MWYVQFILPGNPESNLVSSPTPTPLFLLVYLKVKSSPVNQSHPSRKIPPPLLATYTLLTAAAAVAGWSSRQTSRGGDGGTYTQHSTARHTQQQNANPIPPYNGDRKEISKSKNDHA